MRIGQTIFSILVILILASSCSDFRKIQKSTDWKMKYDAAMEYYKNEDYYRSSILFEEIMPYVKGKAENEEVQFYYAYVQYYQRQYVLAAHYFKNFYDTYRRSEYAEEALYMHAYSLYMQSPPYNLDQTSSREAIDALQAFINKYPDSKFMPDAVDIIEELRVKLEKKAFENARLYYLLGYYVAADIAFDNFEKDFPDSDYNDDIDYLKILSMYEYAEKSVPSKQVERFKKAVEYYQEFIDDNPDSELLPKAEELYEASVSELDKLNQSNS